MDEKDLYKKYTAQTLLDDLDIMSFVSSLKSSLSFRDNKEVDDSVRCNGYIISAIELILRDFQVTIKLQGCRLIKHFACIII